MFSLLIRTFSQREKNECEEMKKRGGKERSFLHYACCVEANKNAAATPAALQQPHKQTNNAANSNRNRNSNRKSAIERERAEEERGGERCKRRNKSKCNTELCFLVELNNCG